MINFVGMIGNHFFGKELRQTGPSLTFARLCTSRHVDDLQSIASMAILAAAVGIVSVLLMSRDFTALKDEIIFLSGLVATAMATLSWAYQAGSRRLGAVDLFASEISVICRVCLIIDFAKTCVASAETAADAIGARVPSDPHFDKFASQEHYTPAFDRSIADLQSLDFDVVTNVTRFYTYRMTMMDLLRKLADSEPAQKGELLRQMIYMQYLMYESARFAIVKLIEFEPHQSEAVINVLCSELVLYGFLKPTYEGRFQGERLDLRVAEYDRTVASLVWEVADNKMSPNWRQASATAPEMVARYNAMQKRLGVNPAVPLAA